MRWRKFVPFILLILPLLFLYLGISYHDSFYYLVAAISLFFSVLVVVPNLLPKKFTHFKLPRFKFKKPSVYHVWNDNGSKPTSTESKKHQNLLVFIVKSPFSLLFLVYLLIFTYISVFILSATNSSNFVFSYYISYLDFAKKSGVSILIPLVLATVLIYLLKNASKKKFSLRNYPSSKLRIFISSILVLFLAFNFSLVSTFLFGVGEVNVLAVKIRSNPESAGFAWGKDKVLQKLKSMNHPPKVIDGGQNFSAKVILGESISSNSRGEYYAQYIVASLPSTLVIPVSIPNEPLVMFGDNLIINSLDKDQIEAISPTLAKLLVKKYFTNRFIKDEPSLQVLGRQDYLKFREDQINTQIAEIDKLINAATDLIKGINGNIANDKSKIAYNQNAIAYYTDLADASYKYCINNGYTDYFTNTFVHFNTPAICESNKTQYDGDIAQFKKNVTDWQSQLQYDQSQLPQYQEAKDTLTSYKILIASQKDSTPQELGVFIPGEKTIKIALDYTGSKSVTEYLETITHEYLHYTSYVSEERSLPQFFEEGLTETYARKVIKKELGKDTNIGYPLLVKIIQQMITKIPEDKLQEIYFTKDKNELQAVLDDAYGKDFYKNSDYYFSIMSYVPPKEALKFANNIMIKIGGKSLTEEDLVSSLPRVN